ncbi:uncharacterized protein [Argopecten irradians]|uniref:uncharacterized protein n=1 Tax=Argopecten irradians TaxID=31199 RepID=UPI00371546AD
MGCRKKTTLIDRLCSGLQDNFHRFAKEIGYSDEQVTKFEHAFSEPGAHQIVLLRRWYDTAGKHTTKQDHIIYQALLSCGLEDVAFTCFFGNIPDPHSNDVLEDLYTDVKKILPKEENTDLDLPRRPKKKKKKRNKRDVDTRLDIPNRHLHNVLGETDVPVTKCEVDPDDVLRDTDAGVTKFEVASKNADNDTELELPGRSKKKKKKQNKRDAVTRPDIPDPYYDGAQDNLHTDVKTVYVPPMEPGEDTVSHADGKEQIIMIGKSNMYIFNNYGTSPESGHMDDKECLETLKEILVSSKQSSDHKGRFQMKLNSLETCFKQKKSKTFKTVMGISLIDFLRKMSSCIDLKWIDQQWFVRMYQEVTQNVHIDKQSEGNKAPLELQESTVNSTPLQTKGTKPQQSHSETSSIRNKSFERPKREIKDHPYEPNKCSEFDDFLKKVGHFQESESAYVLMISKLNKTKHETALANIPWLCVFDFDTESFSNGLINRVEDTYRKHRTLMSCTWQDQPSITSSGTEWCFVLGSTHNPDSKTPSGNCKQWYFKVQDHLTNHVKNLATFLDTVVPLTVVMFWPEDTITGFQFEKVLSCINYHVRPLPYIVIAGCPPREHDLLIEQISPDYSLQEKFDHVLHDMSSNLGRVQSGKQLQYSLPTDDGTLGTDISESNAADLKEDMHVLYCDNPYRVDWADLNKPEDEERLFFKGGTLSWQTYYDYGPEHFYEPRDLLFDILTTIKRDYLEKFQSGIIKLYHEPGAGGTTLGQKILWDLHESTPCLQIRSDASSSIRDIAEKIEFLYKKTYLPIVIMLDGPDEKIFDQLKCHLKTITVVFLLLKRVTDHIDESCFHSNQFLLRGTLSPKEAKRICPKFRRFCDNNAKKDQLQQLQDEVIAGQKHHMIEFGLVTYLDEYTGVAAYVAEYLRLNSKADLESLENFQKVLGYIALVQFYGQVAMPIQLFSKMLGTSEEKISLKQLPKSVQEFIVMEDKKRNSIRICHYLIAKEILEQILARTQSSIKGLELSRAAKQNLQPFVLMFISDLKSRQTAIGQKSSRAVFEIILQTFIHRDHKMMNDSDDPLKSQATRLSRLIESIPSEQPFTERLEVLKSLANTFPDNPSLWAHLGRAYAFFRLHEVDKIENFFQKAFSLCKDDNNNDDSHILSCIYHMHGMFYLKKIVRRIEQSRKIKHEMSFQEEIRKMTRDADTGCLAFEESTKRSYAGFQESFGRMGEISIRLEICNLLKCHYNFTKIQQLLEKSQNETICTFVKESLLKIQQLFMQCHNVVDSAHADGNFYAKVERYNEIFKGMIPQTYIDLVKVPDTIATRREVVASIKNKYGGLKHIGTVDDITEEADINQVILLLQKNIEEDGRHSLDFDYLDWIYATRNPKQRNAYTVENALKEVRQWYALLGSPYSSFYLFCLLCVYGINHNEISYIEEAIQSRSKESKSLNYRIQHSNSPREWLGNEVGIRCLQSGKRFRRMESLDIVDDKLTHVENLQLFSGTIRNPNKFRQKGNILLDIEGNTDVSVNVFFRPSRTEEQLYGTQNSGVRVEFVLAFTVQNGLEAYNVRRLIKVTCSKCDSKLELTSRMRARKCRECETLVYNPNTS